MQPNETEPKDGFQSSNMTNLDMKEAEDVIDFDDLVKMHNENSLDKPFETAKDFMDNMKYDIPLNNLYKVIASCQF